MTFRSAICCVVLAAVSIAQANVAMAIADAPRSPNAGEAWLRVEATRVELLARSAITDDAIDYGRFQWVPASSVDEAALGAAGIAVRRFEQPFVLDLGGQRFDPLVAPPIPASNSPSGHEADWHLVQFRGPIKPEWLNALRESGVVPAQYIHPYTYVVWSDPVALDRAQARPEVRWSGDFQTAFRTRPEQRNLDASLRPTMLLVSRHADAPALLHAIESLGATVRSTSVLDAHFSVIDVLAAGNRYPDLATLAGVYTVQATAAGGGPRGEMSGQSIVGAYGPAPTYTIVPGYQSWLDALGYDGTGVVVSVVDGGIRTTHQDLASRMVPCVPSGATPTSCSTASDSHGTHVAGAIAGTGASGILLNGFLRGKGVAPGANLVQQRYGSFLGGGPGSMIADGMLKIYKESSLSGAVLTNNSWGPTGSPQGYDIPTQQVDMVIRDANPDLPGNQQVQNVWSIMNGNGDGGGACAPSSLGSPDEAKNLFAIGSTSMQSGSGAQSAGIFNVSGNSAHGNACDGRRVPNVVAPGCSTDSTSNSSDTSFTFLCGTSMASPVASGASAVFVQKYRAEHAGATPSPAMIKAAFTAVARDLEGFRDADGRIMGHRPDRFQGYGRIDLDAVVNTPDPIFTLDQTETLGTTGAEWKRSFSAADPTRPVRIMLAWTDAKGHGLGGTTPAWVNDLDLSVTSNAVAFSGNVIGTDGWSASGGSADNKNNLEGVFLRPDQITGPFEIKVLGANIAADALNPYTPGAPGQDFALVCYNCADALLGSADLGVSVVADPAVAEAGASIDLIVNVANLGADAASGAQLVLDLPAGLIFDTSAVSAGTATWSCSPVGQTITCEQTGGSLPVDASAAALTFTTHVGLVVGPGDMLNVAATISAPLYADVDTGNNATNLAIPVGDQIFANGFENPVSVFP